jgi:hypothetical protein
VEGESENARLERIASLEAVDEAKTAYAENRERVGEITNEHLALLLGRLIREIRTLSVRLDFLESLLQQRRQET